jgi:hypothetical protein
VVKPDQCFLKTWSRTNTNQALKELHDGTTGGHFVDDITSHKILIDNYYWPKLFKYAHAYIKKCRFFLIGTRREKLSLKPITINEPFQQSDLDIIGR